MQSRRLTHLLLATALTLAPAARPQNQPLPPPPPPSTHPAADTFFTGTEKFERNATRVTRVENDHNRNHQAHSNDPGQPRRLSTVYVFDYDGPDQYNPADVELYRRKLHTPEWTCKACDRHLKPGEAIDACTRPAGPSSTESVVIEMRLDKLTFVHSIGGAPHEVVCHEY